MTFRVSWIDRSPDSIASDRLPFSNDHDSPATVKTFRAFNPNHSLSLVQSSPPAHDEIPQLLTPPTSSQPLPLQKSGLFRL